MPDIEELLRAAIQAGKFDNLPGKGKPLKLDENPYANPEWRVAYHILNEAGFTLPWIETRNEIEVELEKARSDLRYAWEWREKSTEQDSHSSENEWRKALEAFHQKVDAINKRIKDFNLMVPSVQFQMSNLNYEREVSLLTESQTR